MRGSHRFHLVLTACVASAVAFWAGHLTYEYAPQSPLEVNVPPPPACPELHLPEPPACPVHECPPLALHQRVLEARCEVRVADAYVRGIEDNEDACSICKQAEHELRSCRVEECGKELHDWHFDMMDLGIQTIAMDIEQSRWSACCQELIRVWPTPSGEYGTYPEDFPRYCR